MGHAVFVTVIGSLEILEVSASPLPIQKPINMEGHRLMIGVSPHEIFHRGESDILSEFLTQVRGSIIGWDGWNNQILHSLQGRVDGEGSMGR